MHVHIGPYNDSGYTINHVKIEEFDTWNMDVTLSHIIVPMLEQFIKNCKSCAHIDLNDIPGVDPNIKSQDYETEFKHWQYVLGEMLFAFKFVRDEDSFSTTSNKSLEARVNNGLRLFGKYYRYLWD